MEMGQDNNTKKVMPPRMASVLSLILSLKQYARLGPSIIIMVATTVIISVE